MANESKGAALGILIDSDLAYGVLVRSTRSVPEVVALTAVEMPRDAVEGSSIIDPHRVAIAVKSLRRELNFTDRSATVAIPSPGYSMRAVRFPDVPAWEQRTLVRGELEEVGALPFGGGAFDYVWIPLQTGEDVRQADVSAYYSTDKNVEDVLATLKLAGFQLEGLEPASLCMMRAYLAGVESSHPIAFLSPADRHTDLCIHDGTRIRHIRRIPAGIADLTRPEAADRVDDLDTTASMPEAEAHGGQSIPGISGFELPEMLPREHDTEAMRGEQAGPLGAGERSSTPFLAAEVARTLAFYARENEEAARPRELAILGPENVASDFKALLEHHLTIRINTPRAMETLRLPQPVGARGSLGHSHRYMAAIGAAIGALGIDVGIPRVDISQQESAARTRRRAPAVLLAGMAGSTIWMVASAVASIALIFMESRAQQDLNSATLDLETLKAQRAPSLKYQDLMTAATAAEAQSLVPAGAILGRVAASSVPGVVLTHMRASADGKVTLEGQAVDARAMQLYLIQLSRGRSIKGPYVEKLKQEADDRVVFTVIGRFKPAGALGTPAAK